MTNFDKLKEGDRVKFTGEGTLFAKEFKRVLVKFDGQDRANIFDNTMAYKFEIIQPPVERGDKVTVVGVVAADGLKVIEVKDGAALLTDPEKPFSYDNIWVVSLENVEVSERGRGDA